MRDALHGQRLWHLVPSAITGHVQGKGSRTQFLWANCGQERFVDPVVARRTRDWLQKRGPSAGFAKEA